MLKPIKQFLKKYYEMNNAIDYVANHICYHLANTRKLRKTGDMVTMFGQQQLHLLVESKTSNLTVKQINKIITLAIKNAIADTKASFMITRNTIYIALL